jgi:HPt (histidine-containing phosphotransfer) domain-containing protein
LGTESDYNKIVLYLSQVDYFEQDKKYSEVMEYKFISTEYLDSVSGGDADTICEIVDIFREQCVEMVKEMKSLNTSGNFKALGLLAHKAKSSVAIMGMEDLALMLKTMELQAKEGKDTLMYGSYIDRFENETRAAIEELDDFISNNLNKG